MQVSGSLCCIISTVIVVLETGYNRMIRSFSTSEPGRVHTNLATSPSRKSPYGQKGIISCISFNPDYSGTLIVELLSFFPISQFHV